MNGVNALIDYFSLFKICEENNDNDNVVLDNIDKILNILNDTKNRTSKVQYINDLDLIENIVSKNDISNELEEYLADKYGTSIKDLIQTKEYLYLKDLISNSNKGIDNILYDIMLNVNRYNLYLMNKKTKKQDISLSTDITFDNLNIDVKDVLNYLDVKDGDLDKELLNDINLYIDLDKFKEFAIAIKTDNGMRRVLYDKISDKNVLISILLHSNVEIVDNIIEIFEKEHANINRVVSNIPSIFIKDYISVKSKYNLVTTNYDNFINNYKLLKENNIDFKKMLNFSVFFINDPSKNAEVIENLDNIEEGL